MEVMNVTIVNQLKTLKQALKRYPEDGDSDSFSMNDKASPIHVWESQCEEHLWQPDLCTGSQLAKRLCVRVSDIMGRSEQSKKLMRVGIHDATRLLNHMPAIRDNAFYSYRGFLKAEYKPFTYKELTAHVDTKIEKLNKKPFDETKV